jgi:hypothetical protein
MRELTTEQIETRVWAIIALSLTFILVVSVVSIILGVLFVEHDMENISPIDEKFLSILKDVMMLSIGAVGGIAGRQGAKAAANLLANKESDDATTRPAA